MDILEILGAAGRTEVVAPQPTANAINVEVVLASEIAMRFYLLADTALTPH